ncbi:antibiotic resistance protein VanZ [Deinococcus aquiradiocola]|uniref:Uncharacterized protein n=1 Tax=Deinococcus aquiradiocola TaxID=393059 RepID=A0A917PQS8_9DEIO|nr:antibiotic resistance protein VanZ [Deinococcus aquiradiocola]GGJ88470.1 hypothetical protein GCM10008939_35710 [Deinococcus aquiradiocola]
MRGLLAILALAGAWLYATGGVILPAPLGTLADVALYLLLGALLARWTGGRASGLALAAWASAVDQVHRAFVPGHEVGIVPWLFTLLAAWVGTRLAVRVRREPPVPPVFSQDFPAA